jgi:hypothetical protein
MSIYICLHSDGYGMFQQSIMSVTAKPNVRLTNFTFGLNYLLPLFTFLSAVLHPVCVVHYTSCINMSAGKSVPICKFCHSFKVQGVNAQRGKFIPHQVTCAQKCVGIGLCWKKSCPCMTYVCIYYLNT